MKNSADIQHELLQISNLIKDISKETVFVCPEKYFESFSDEINLKIRLNDTKSRPTLTMEDSTYFESFPAKLLEKISPEKEQNEMTADLKSLLNKPLFDIPENYFERLDAEILIKKGMPTATQRLAPIFSVRNIMYAAAAMVTILITISWLRWSLTKNSSDTQLAQLEESLQKGLKMDVSKIDQAIETLTESDILLYLDENSNESDIASIENLVNEETLPNEEDYFTNEKVFDEYLSQIKNSSNN